MPEVSPFLEPGPLTKVNSLAILQLSRDNLQPVYLKSPDDEHDGYAEGAVVNTRYGSFPHSTMIGVPWGSQIRASKVDTGSRGRKRKRQLDEDAGRDVASPNENENDNDNGHEVEARDAHGPAVSNAIKKAVADTSGFIHILPPIPEIWTMSLPHRTQVVYTPDYSYILHRLRARPGAVIIEAGAGSGSFTHAAARAVYNGYSTATSPRKGKVISFEYHEQRYHKMSVELSEHGLEEIVHLTHRDVYKDGFLLDGKSPEADAIFLDLPAPWDALHHLSRRRPAHGGDEAPWVSVLNPKRSAYVCTFSPCIEQVTKTVSAMRRLGWVDIEMVEIAHRKLHTARDRVGLNLAIDRGVNNSARDVDEAIARLAEIEDRFREHSRPKGGAGGSAAAGGDVDDMDEDEDDKAAVAAAEAPTNGDASSPASSSIPSWMDGRLVARGEAEIKTHTSYLVFAVLPREWTAEDEAAAAEKYPCSAAEKKIIGSMDKAARKKERRELLAAQQGNRKARRKARDEKMGEGAL
ncbi:tRNA methyltransferase complex GCD14 subunit-domain-containing protein [Lasiosphaeria miniovina]|uniref:tRNA (adenine(58)-N(1))-methyltransferase catalytic subunit TRM61 n=1 Tax=Lasiosphaeria miniovina TaxID=1954250 RepID=A0AA40EAI8_9PEZI|nr:tRNA methyltransferase complex GCD14 subunit-domain-containing protein [Lasiosphaeria miniovina]KAK0728373.1 tRNA methyltransferase complex GCD14 subunit-domain-containing protein [Lasiosphaeria miniovina]